MTKLSRREFTGSMAALAALSLAGRRAFANPLGLPLGIQLYSVRDQMAADFEGALAGVAAAGFTEVEAASLPKRSAGEVRAALDKAGLRCVSAHHPFNDLHTRFDEIAAYDKQLGVSFIICASPGHRNPPAGAPSGSHGAFTLDDWYYNADQFNEMGEKLAGQGIRFGYHNHVPEFATTEGKVPYLELMRLTDPKKVTFELDCGWATVAGMNPIDILKNNPHRISMLHIKDFKAPTVANPKPEDFKIAELGMGSVSYQPILAEAARSQHIEHAFVEQEAFSMPWKESLKVDADYVRKLT